MTENGKRKPICPYADRAENLERRNEILETGQRVYDIDNKKSKIGDGEKHWNDLPWESTGGGSSITVDDTLSDISTNPVQNKAIKAVLDNKQNTLNFDDTPTADSTNPVTSGGVKTYVDTKVAESSNIDETAVHYKGEFGETSLPDTPVFGDVWKVCNDIKINGTSFNVDSFVYATSKNTIEFDGNSMTVYDIYPGTKFTVLNSDKTKTVDCTVKYIKVERYSSETMPPTVFIYVNEDISTAFNITSYVQVSIDNMHNNSLNVKSGDLIVYTYSGWQKFYSESDTLKLERLKYYGDPDIVPSDESYFTVNSTGETIMGLSDIGKTQTELVIPYKIDGKEITRIGGSAFNRCTSLTSINIPNSVTSIGNDAFYSCTSLTSVSIPNSVTSIGDRAFSVCTSLTSIEIPNSVTSIEQGAFSGCRALTLINIPNSVTSIGQSAFAGCSSLTSIDIPNSVTSIGDRAFYNCTSLTSIYIPNSVTSIGDYAFSYCTSLTSINIPDGVTSIENYAFENCTSLTSINIPNSVTSISDEAFDGCTSLTIYCEQGSYAETYANNNYIPIVYTAINNVASGKVTTITVPTTGWTTSTDTNGTTYYSINITDSILTSAGYPITDVVLPSDIAAARLQSEAYQNVNKITVNDGSVKLYCFDSLPTVSFQIRIQILYI